MSEPNVRDLLFMSDNGQGVAIGVYSGDLVRIGVGEESFHTSARSLFDMMKFYSAAGFKLESPSPEMLDAQRYRYLRDRAGTGDDFDGPMVCDGAGDLFDYLRGADVDEAVDAAMLAERAIPIVHSSKEPK